MPRWTNPKRRGEPAATVASVPGKGLPRMLDSFQKFRTELLARRGQLDQQIQGIDALVGALQGRGRTVRVTGGRGARAGSLKDHIQQVLQKSGQPMAVREITQTVVDNGYVTSNKTLANSVSLELPKIPGVRRVSRGIFAVR